MLTHLAKSTLFGKRMQTLFEVPCTAGVPDVVFVHFDDVALTQRADRSTLADLAEVRVMMAAAQSRSWATKTWTVDDMATVVDLTPTHLRRSVLPRLVAGGHLEKTGADWRTTYRFRSLAKRIVTVEAKLRDWRGAVAQASRHTSVADAAWVAIDAASGRAAANNPQWFFTYGVGLATVSSDGSVLPLIKPSEPRPRPVERELLAERTAGLYLTGRVSGDIPQVFGKTLLATTGSDPRLADAPAH
ncbi:hypothetical protein OG203_10755 [Nocardia sp. NBC_01499]|uniref:hypothetical protein n=1 Tax=Nocardia sp. NBC_01499 TaxID=2903597 RepID=UPI00386F9506